MTVVASDPKAPPSSQTKTGSGRGIGYIHTVHLMLPQELLYTAIII